MGGEEGEGESVASLEVEDDQEDAPARTQREDYKMPIFSQSVFCFQSTVSPFAGRGRMSFAFLGFRAEAAFFLLYFLFFSYSFACIDFVIILIGCFDFAVGLGFFRDFFLSVSFLFLHTHSSFIFSSCASDMM